MKQHNKTNSQCSPLFQQVFGLLCLERGLEYAGDEDSEAVKRIRARYPELGKCLYFDLAPGSHNGLFEIPSKRINWIWYINQPEPPLKVVQLPFPEF